VLTFSQIAVRAECDRLDALQSPRACRLAPRWRSPTASRAATTAALKPQDDNAPDCLSRFSVEFRPRRCQHCKPQC